MNSEVYMSLSFKHANEMSKVPACNTIKPMTQAQDELNKAHLFEERTHQLDAEDLQHDAHLTDTRNAMWNYLRAALRGDKEAQYKMGIGYLKGELSLDRSYTHAEKWLDQASEHGHQQAKHELEKALNEISIS